MKGMKSPSAPIAKPAKNTPSISTATSVGETIAMMLKPMPPSKKAAEPTRAAEYLSISAPAISLPKYNPESRQSHGLGSHILRDRAIRQKCSGMNDGPQTSGRNQEQDGDDALITRAVHGLPQGIPIRFRFMCLSRFVDRLHTRWRTRHHKEQEPSRNASYDVHVTATRPAGESVFTGVFSPVCIPRGEQIINLLFQD